MKEREKKKRQTEGRGKERLEMRGERVQRYLCVLWGGVKANYRCTNSGETRKNETVMAVPYLPKYYLFPFCVFLKYLQCFMYSFWFYLCI